jgi:uroporphyrinogen-III synthase
MSAPTILVTRPESARAELANTLTGLGYAVATVPTIAIEPLPPGGPLDIACRTLQKFDWVALTSPNAARAVIAARQRHAAGRPIPAHPPLWAAIGAATSEVLAAENVPVDLVPPRSTGISLVAALIATGRMGGSRILLPRSDSAGDTMPSLLRRAGADVDAIEGYQTVEAPESSLGPLADVLDEPTLAAIVVASGSAARGLVTLSRQVDRLSRLRGISIVSIGPSTSAVLRGLGLEPAAEAAGPTSQAIAEAVASLPPEAARNQVSRATAQPEYSR